MEGDDYDHAGSSQQKKKKKSKKSRRNLEEEFNCHAQTLFQTEEIEEQELSQEDPEVNSSPSKKKKKKKKKLSEEPPPPSPPEEEEEEEEEVVPEPTPPAQQNKAKRKKKASSSPVAGTSSALKKEVATPKKTPAKPRGRQFSTSEVRPPNILLPPPDLAKGINILANMSHEDLETLLNRVEQQSPLGDVKKVALREAAIDWDKVAFSYYTAEHCRTAWNYLMTQTRKQRIMWELVQEVKFNLQTDYLKFMQKNIESAPDFPKQPVACTPFQAFCREKWEEHKHLQERMNDKVENFLYFQTKCHERWNALGPEKQKKYEQMAQLAMAEYKQKVHEYYLQYPAFIPQPPKTEKPEPKERVMSETMRRKFVKMSQELCQDAPREPLTPMQLYIQHKIKRVQPTPLPHEEPEVKSRYVGLWKELSKEKKLRWIDKCLKYCDRYQEEVIEYKKANPMFLLPKTFQVSRLINKEEFGIWAEFHGQPPVPRATVKDMFIQDFRRSEEAEGMSIPEANATAEEKFKQLSHLDLERLKLKFKLHHLNFKSEIEEYLKTVPDIMKSKVIENLPKKYRMQIMEEVDKAPLVKDDDLMELIEGSSSNSNDNATTQKRKASETNTSPSKKKKKSDAPEVNGIPLYAQQLNDQHVKLLEESFTVPPSAKKDVSKASNYFPGSRITPSKKKQKKA